MRHFRVSVCLVFLALAVSGCSEQSIDTGTHSGPVSGKPLVNRTLLSDDIVANAGVESTATIQVPHVSDNGTRIRVLVQLDQGAWQSFRLSGLPDQCNHVTTAQGLTISGGQGNGSGGSTCLAPSGDYTLRFKVETGAVKGHLTVTAEAPA
jgi:hypothetical protein